jgi:hypothetical protein
MHPSAHRSTDAVAGRLSNTLGGRVRGGGRGGIFGQGRCHAGVCVCVCASLACLCARMRVRACMRLRVCAPHLWRDVLRRADKALAVLVDSESQGRPKVDQLQVAHVVQQDVGRLQVAVDETAGGKGQGGDMARRWSGWHPARGLGGCSPTRVGFDPWGGGGEGRGGWSCFSSEEAAPVRRKGW